VKEAAMAKGELRILSAAQMEIMQLIWDRGEVAVSEVWETLSLRRPVARNTVQTLMLRMEEKGWIKHRVVGRTFFYEAVSPRGGVGKDMVAALLKSLFRGSAEQLAAALLENTSLTKSEASRIRALIDAAEKRKAAKK
jgi:BlaI family penicillinase repressor